MGEQMCCRERAFHRASMLLLVAGFTPVAAVAHCRGIVTVGLEVIAESGILVGDCVLVEGQSSISKQCYVSRSPYLVNLRHHEQGHEGGQDTQRAGNEERILAPASRIRCVLLDDWKHIGAHESPYLSKCGGVRVVLTTDGSRAGLGRTQTNVVTRSHLTESREDSRFNILAMTVGQN
jgi:hypothetical protein